LSDKYTSLDQVISFLESFFDENRCNDYKLVNKFLEKEKTKAKTQRNESRANFIWLLQESLKVQKTYIEAFNRITSKDYYNAWCNLESCEISLKNINYNFPAWSDCFGLSFIQRNVVQYQQLFPYVFFASPEILEHKVRCSICGKTYTLSSHCNHELGRVYNGELCYRIIEKPEFCGISLVTNPIQKFSVVFPEDNNFDYSLLEFFHDKLNSPLEIWLLEHFEVFLPFWSERIILPEVKCLCGSQKLFVDCCLKKPGYRGRIYVITIFSGRNEVYNKIEFPDHLYLKEVAEKFKKINVT